jgi:putative restriction endonuclease
MKDAAYYVEKFTQLRRDEIPGRWTHRTANKAPHKPILLISVADAYVEQPTRSNSVGLDDSLQTRFEMYWSYIFNGQRKSTVALPFYHLKSDGFWHLVPVAVEVPEPCRKSFSALKTVVTGASLDGELHALLAEPRWANHLRSVLITTYFAPDLHREFFKN